MEGTPQKFFTTSDVWTASYLEYRGIIPQLENRNGRIVFQFPTTDTLYKLLNAFNSGDAVPLTEYIDTYKTLKVKMFQARGPR
jgi:hypothetical protein